MGRTRDAREGHEAKVSRKAARRQLAELYGARTMPLEESLFNKFYLISYKERPYMVLGTGQQVTNSKRTKHPISTSI